MQLTKHNSLCLPLLVFLVVPSALGNAGESRKGKATRRFRFEYSAVVNDLPVGSKVRIWLPLPPSNGNQDAKILKRRLPAPGTVHTESKYGNRMLYMELRGSESKKVSFGLTYEINRREIRSNSIVSDDLPANVRSTFLSSNRKVPTGGRPLELLEGVALPKDQLQLARLLYERVDNHMRYDKSQPGYGTGDSVWACQSGFGNCTDFHSLFISLTRSQKLPSRFTIGFPLPDQRGKGDIAGYHCWADVYTNGKWLPVDISEADKHPELKQYYFGNLTENRVAFTVGRDITLSPRQAGPPLNFFVYPYLEADGKPIGPSQMALRFRYEDLK